jgi:hypothetical protein
MNGLTLFQEPAYQWAPALKAMAANGVTVVRSDASWGNVQTLPPVGTPTYNFSTLDPWVSALAEAGLTWMPILDDTPWWAKTCVGQCPPLDMAWFSEYASAVAARYGANGTFWAANPTLPYHPVQDFEIWNEENGTQFWSTGPSGSQYATMYADARAAIKSVDPSGEAIVGGLGTGDASDFVVDMFSAMPSLKGNVDGFALHPYAATAAEDEQNVVAFRETLDSLGESSAPIDLTEFGFVVGASTADEDTRAWFMGQLGQTLGNSNCGIGILAPYTWLGNGSDPPDYALTTDGSDLYSAGLAWFTGLHKGESGTADNFCPASTPAPSTLPASTSTAPQTKSSKTETTKSTDTQNTGHATHDSRGKRKRTKKTKKGKRGKKTKKTKKGKKGNEPTKSKKRH